MDRQRLEELRIRLQTVSDDIGDISIELLREAVKAGRGRPELDRTLSRVRRSVDKAVVLLGRLDDQTESSSGSGPTS
jgi:hypothetical protein